MQNFGGVIWTHHALRRLDERKLPQEMAFAAFQNPDQVIKNNDGSTEYKKKFGNSFVNTVAKQNEKKEWIIISCWIDPPMAGTADFKKKEAYGKYKKAGFWGKLFIIFKNQLGF